MKVIVNRHNIFVQWNIEEIKTYLNDSLFELNKQMWESGIMKKIK